MCCGAFVAIFCLKKYFVFTLWYSFPCVVTAVLFGGYMRFVFLSNYLSVHQLSFCQNMYEKLGEDFSFIATTRVNPLRLTQGYSDMNSQYDFVIRAYENPAQWQKAKKRIDEADVVVIGSAPMQFVQKRLQENKLTFLYSERLYKAGYQAWKLPVRLWRFWKKYGRYKSLYLLCASAYTAGDYAKTGTFLKKAYKWGYFPRTFCYDDVDAMIERKKSGTILWTARFIDWKHPEHVLEVAKRLIRDGYHFQIKMLGNGALWNAFDRQIRELGLTDYVELTGAIPAEQVREYMDAASVFLLTSDRNEGWGAVLNESMNSACGVVASDAIGSVPFLLKDGENGLQYRSCDVDDLYEKVKYLLDNPDACRKMGKAAYETVTRLWNSETAVQRILQLSETLLHGQKHPDLFCDGPCSRAKRLKGDAS